MPRSRRSAIISVMFQSAPGREAGRCLATRVECLAFRSFNPRPAVRPGDARQQVQLHAASVSFQSAPGREAGRCPLPEPHRPRRIRFNPRPAVRPGDALIF